MLGPGQIIVDIYTEQLVALNHHHFSTIDADCTVYNTLFPEVND